MKETLKKTIAAMCTAFMILPFASCGKTEDTASSQAVVGADPNSISEIQSGDAVTGSSLWYDTTKLDFVEPSGISDYTFKLVEFIGLVSDKFVYTYNCQWHIDGVTDNRLLLVTYDMQGQLVRCDDVKQVVDCSAPNTYPVSIVKGADSVVITTHSFDETTRTSSSYNYNYDVNTGTCGAPTEITDPTTREYIGYFQYDVKQAGEYKITTMGSYEDDNTYMYITDGTSVVRINLMEQIPSFVGASSISVASAIYKGDGKILARISSSLGSKYYEVDFTNAAITESTADYSWLDPYLNDIKSVEGYGSVIVKESGIMRVNFDNNCVEELFSFSNSNVNRFDASLLVPIEITDDRVVLCGTTTRGYEDKSIAYVLQKSDTNPNEGKTVLRLASLSGYSYALCDAVCKFNDTNPSCFVIFDSRYDPENFSDIENTNIDSMNLYALSAMVSADLSRQIALDLTTGDGPDIIVGGANYSQLNNANCLVDLSGYIQSNLPSDSYYSNVFNAYAVNGAVYQIPVTFGIAGIATSSANVNPGQVGLTFDQYGSLVNGAWNGMNPIAGGKLDFFVTTISGMNDLMFENGNANYDNEAFRALAQYTSANVFEPVVSEDTPGYDIYGVNVTSDAPARSMIVKSISTYHRYVADLGYVLLGYPSYDGRGPIVVGTESIGISAQSASVEGCMQFIDTVMSEDCQISFATSMDDRSGIPVNRAAFNSTADEYIRKFNVDYQAALSSPDGGSVGCKRAREYESFLEFGRSSFHGPADESLKTSLETLINSLSGSGYSVDAPINVIIREEIPAYFEGQKSLDEVIGIINNRVQTVIDERG